MDENTRDTLELWKDHRYKPDHLPFRDAVYSLLTDHPVIHLVQKQDRPNEWMVSVRRT